MTVHVITPAGDLAGTSTPVQFSLDREAVTISVEYLDETPKRWEVVYGGTDSTGANGRFSDLFASSDRVSNLYTVRPPGPYWEGRFQLVVDEVVDSPATLWEVLYDRDLRSLANQAIIGDSSSYQNFTLDGQPWYVHTSSGDLALVNGQGLVGHVSGDASSGNQYAGIHFGLKVSEMSGYNANKQVACQVQWDGLLTDLTGNQCVGASHWTGNEAWGYGPGNNAIITRLYGSAWSMTAMNYHTVSDLGFTFRSDPPTPELQNNFCLGSWAMPYSSDGRRPDRNYRGGLCYRGVDNVEHPMPTVEKMMGLGAWNSTGNAEDARHKMGFYAGQPSGSRAFKAVRIRILQRSFP